MKPFKIGDKVAWIIEKDFCYYGRVAFDSGYNKNYPVRVILEKTGNAYSFTENGVYDITSKTSTYIRHLTKLEQVLR